MSDILGWSHDASDIPERGLEVERRASATELARLVEALDLVSCDSLLVRYRVKPVTGGGYRVSGNLEARLAQHCIVSLEPVEAVASSPIEVEYWASERRAGEVEEGEIEALSAAEIEPLVNGRLDVGRVVFEQLAAALDPYPRKPEAEFTPPPEAPPGGGVGGPFAALARLKGDKP